MGKIKGWTKISDTYWTDGENIINITEESVFYGTSWFVTIGNLKRNIIKFQKPFNTKEQAKEYAIKYMRENEYKEFKNWYKVIDDNQIIKWHHNESFSSAVEIYLNENLEDWNLIINGDSVGTYSNKTYVTKLATKYMREHQNG